MKTKKDVLIVVCAVMLIAAALFLFFFLGNQKEDGKGAENGHIVSSDSIGREESGEEAPSKGGDHNTGLDGFVLDGNTPTEGQAGVKEEARWKGVDEVNKEGLLSLRPGVDWSDGEVSETELIELMGVISLLIQEKYKKQGNEVKVSTTIPEAKDILQDNPPVYYYVEDGILTLRAQIVVTEKQKVLEEGLRSVSLYYELDQVKMK